MFHLQFTFGSRSEGRHVIGGIAIRTVWLALVQRHLALALKMRRLAAVTVSFTATGLTAGCSLRTRSSSVFVPTPRIRTGRRGKPGSYSFHSQYRLPPELGRGELSIQHNNTREEDGGRYRAEHLRPIAEGDRYYSQLYGKRNRSETHNSDLQRTLKPWGRAHSYGALAQLTDNIAHAIGVNALVRADHRHRKRGSEAA